MDDDLAGQAIKCRECGEWGRVPAPKVPPKTAPSPPVRPRRERPARREPWFYDFLEKYAFVTLVLGAVASVPLLLGAFVGVVKAGWEFVTSWGFLVAVGGVLVFLSGCFSCAFLLLVVDIGKSLRLMRPKKTTAGRDAE